MADPGHAHHPKEQVKEMRKEAEHEKNVKEKHHHHEHVKESNPYPELQHQVETGKIQVVSADGKVSGEARETIETHPAQH